MANNIGIGVKMRQVDIGLENTDSWLAKLEQMKKSTLLFDFGEKNIEIISTDYE